MLQKVLQTILRKYFGQFITGLQKVSLAFWNGKININNASFKHDKINQILKLYNIPLSIKFSYIGGLQLDIPWKNLTSAPVQIKVNKVFIVFKLQKIADNLMKQQDFKENSKLILIKNYLAYLKQKSQQLKGENESESGFLKKLIIKILHNINLQVNNIHIRIQNNNYSISDKQQNEDDEFVDCMEQQMQKIGFSLGFCIQNIQAQTINARNQKQFAHIQNDKTQMRKSINLKNISFYWQQQSYINFYEYTQEKKIDIMESIINRSKYQLLTIDGQLLMEKNINKFDYFFSTSFRLLEMQVTYEQLKQIIKVYHEFTSIKTKKKIIKTKQLEYSKQLELEYQVKSALSRFNDNKFTIVTKQDIRLLQSIDKKLLMTWTKQEAIQLIKKDKIQKAFELKNKKGWISFLSKSVSVQLTQDQIKTIQNEIRLLIKIVDQGVDKKSIGFYLNFALFQMIVNHFKAQQKLYFKGQDITLQFQKTQNLRINLIVTDMSLTYQDLKLNSRVKIFETFCELSKNKFIQLEIENSSLYQRINFDVEEMSFIHQIQFLTFLSQMINLKQRQTIKTEMMILNSESLKSKPDSNLQKQSQISKLYEYNITMKKIGVVIELTKNEWLQLHVGGINVRKLMNLVNAHKASILNIGIVYANCENKIKKEDKILEDVSIDILVKDGLKLVESDIAKLKMILNEEQLYSIARCLQDQYKIIAFRKIQLKKQEIDEQKYMQGQTQMVNVFKKLTVYHTILTSQEIYFYEKQIVTNKINFNKISKRISIRNAKVTRLDDLNLKIQSVLLNEIIKCKRKEETQKWIYHIQQRIFENSSKMQMFNLMQQNLTDENTPNIFIKYDSQINMHVRHLQIIYQKNKKEKILSLELNQLSINLKENNLLFEREVLLNQIKINNLSYLEENRQEFTLILSNTFNYFEDPNQEQSHNHPHIHVTIEGKKKTHPQYTGQLVIKSKINKLFVNFNTQFLFQILYRLVYGQQKAKEYPDQIRNLKVIQILKEILQEDNQIEQKFANARPLQFAKSYVSVQKYKQQYSCMVLFHVEIKCEDLQVYLVNGRNNHWMHKIEVDGINVNIDKSTDFIFVNASTANFHLYDITSYPKTINKPFTYGHPYPIASSKSKRQQTKAVIQISAGIFEPLVFINKQRFKNFFVLNLYDLHVNYQQQPLMRFVDFLTNQIILFILQPFFFHKFDTPKRGPFVYGPLNFTQKEIKKILYESIHPLFTRVNINGFDLGVNFNSFPQDQFIGFKIKRVNLVSLPCRSPDKIHIKPKQMKQFKNKYRGLFEPMQKQKILQRLVTKSQWTTKYLINAEGISSSLIQNEFNYEMYFQKSNHVEKDIILPFLKIQKNFIMLGKIKHMNFKASKINYNLINKCFIFNLSTDDKLDILFNANHQFKHLNQPNKLIFTLNMNQMSMVIPDLNQTIIIIQNLQYRFIRLEDEKKIMEINGKSLHILGRDEVNIITPINFDEKKGLQYVITMFTNGEKHMTTFLRQIDLHYDQQILMALFKYFLLDQTCYPKQQVYADLPLIKTETYLINSYIKLGQNQEHVFALKGDIKVIWNRYQQTHPQTYKFNKSFYPKQASGSSYDIEFKGISFQKYIKSLYQTKTLNFYRSLSSNITFKINLVNIMKMENGITFSIMNGVYDFEFLCLKLSYKDIMEFVKCFSKQEKQSIPLEEQNRKSVSKSRIGVNNGVNELGYVPHSVHKFIFQKFSFQLGLSQLPVPLVDLTLETTKINLQIIGQNKIITSKLEFDLNSWNMMIGRWQPLIQRAFFDLTLRLGPTQKYWMSTSTKPFLINLSLQSLKIIKLISKDITEKGNLNLIKQEQRAKGIQISPYVINNRTGYSILVNSDELMTAKIKSNDRMHLQRKNIQLDEQISIVSYQIQGDSEMYNLNLNINNLQKQTISYMDKTYRLIIWSISTPVLKQIIISAPYVVYNTTKFPLILSLGSSQFKVQAQSKLAIPFTEQIIPTKTMRIDFLHLKNVKENYNFQFKDIYKGYQHYIVYQDSLTFNCLVNLQNQNQNKITISSLICFVNLLPVELTMELALRKINKQKIMLHSQLTLNEQTIFYEFGSKDEVELRINIKGFNYSEFININLSNDRQTNDIINDIKFIDHRGLSAIIKNKIVKKQKRRYLYIYAESLIINETPYKFYIFNQDQLCAGQRIKNIPESQSKFIFLNDIKKLSIGFNQDHPNQTQKFTNQQIGSQCLTVSHYDRLYQLVVHNSLNCILEDAKIFTSIFKVAPRYILVNKCSRILSFRQFNTDFTVTAKVDDIVDWYWYHREEESLLTFTPIDNQLQMPGGWDYSSPLRLDSIEQSNIIIRPTTKSSQRMIIRLQIFKQNQQFHIVFKQIVNQEESFIKIKNDLKYVNIEIYQSFLQNLNPPWINYKEFICPSYKEIDFGWDYPHQQHLIVIAFNFVGPYRSKYYNRTVKLDFEELRKREEVVNFIGDNDQQLEILIFLQVVGLKKLLVFKNRDESSKMNDEDLIVEMTGNNKLGVSFSDIGISLIGGRNPRSQIMFISIKNFQFIMMQKLNKRNYELKIKYINIDNNLHHNTMYPILFTPLRQKKTLQKSRPFIICLIQQNLKSKQIMQINYIRLCIEPISLKLYDEIVTTLYDWFKQFNETQKIETIDLVKLFRPYQGQFEWLNKKLVKQGASTFIRQIEIGKVIVELSFSIRSTFNGNIIIYTIFTLFKSALSNLSESELKLNRFISHNISLGDLSNQISQFYRKEIFKQFYKIAASINFIGNPYVFVKYLAEGIWEIVNQPSEGFIKGPIEGFLGIGKGGIYFVRNVVAGTSNSFEVIAQSCSRGIASITYDEKYITRRQKIAMQKSRHLGHGTKSALFALYTGVQLAFTGLYRLPKTQKDKNGVPGLFKGIALGITGLFTKPVSGLFEAISKFSEGIKQTALFFQDGPNTIRSRPPRVFMSSQQYFSPYNLQESKAINLLQFHSTKHLKKIILFVSVDQGLQDTTYTILTNQHLVLLSKSHKKIVKQIKLVNVNEVHIIEQQKSKYIKIKYDNQQTDIRTKKYKQLYICFRTIFNANQDQLQQELQS